MGYELGIKNCPNWKVKLLIATILESLLVVLCLGYSYSWKIAAVCFLAYIVCANVRVNVKRRNQILFYAVITLSLGYICLNLSQLIMNENISVNGRSQVPSLCHVIIPRLRPTLVAVQPTLAVL